MSSKKGRAKSIDLAKKKEASIPNLRFFSLLQLTIWYEENTQIQYLVLNFFFFSLVDAGCSRFAVGQSVARS